MLIHVFFYLLHLFRYYIKYIYFLSSLSPLSPLSPPQACLPFSGLFFFGALVVVGVGRLLSTSWVLTFQRCRSLVPRPTAWSRPWPTRRARSPSR